MLVYDFIQLELPFEVAKTSLLDGASRWLDPLATQACSDGQGRLVEVGIVSRRAEVVKQVRVVVGSPHERGDFVTVPLQWQATGFPALFPSLDGELEIARLSLSNTHLGLMGRYEPPLGPVGRLLDEILCHHIVEGSVRMFLRGIAAALGANEAGVGGRALPDPERIASEHG